MDEIDIIVEELLAYGTAEGVKKEWDTRGRGKHFIDWGHGRGNNKGAIFGWHADSGLGGAGNTEGDGLYVSRMQNLANAFGDAKMVYFYPPQKVLDVNEEPLHLLTESDEMAHPIKDGDSEWTRLNKQAFINTGGDAVKWDAEKVGHELTRLMREAGYDAVRVTSGGEQWVVLLDKKLIRSIKAKGEIDLDGVVEGLLASVQPQYPDTHEAAMRVPKGGSSCASCEYLGKDGKSCTNKYFIKWHGSAELPYPADEFCSDWYEPKNDLKAVGTSEGVKKEWDTRGRGKKEDAYQGDGHGTKFSDMKELKDGWLARDGMFYANLDHIHSQTAMWHKLANPAAEWATGDAVANGHVRVSTGDFQTPSRTLILDGRDGDSKVIERMRDALVLANNEHHVQLHFADKAGGLRSKYFNNPGEADEWLQSGNMHAEIDLDAAVVELSSSGTLDGVMFRGVHIIGFTSVEEEQVIAFMSRIPPELVVGVKRVVSDPKLGAIHGRYDANSKTVFFNAKTFRSQTILGRGPIKIHHAQLTMVHEFGHALYSSLPDEKRKEWMALSGWMEGSKAGQARPYVEKRPGWPHKTSKWTHAKDAMFTRHYAEKNPDEDFADTFAFCLLSKPAQAGDVKRQWMGKLLMGMVHAYPQASLEGPEMET